MSVDTPFYFNAHETMPNVVDGEPWSRCQDVATILEYADTNNAIPYNVSEDDRNKMREMRGECVSPGTLMPNPHYISMNQVSIVWSSAGRKKLTYSKHGFAPRVYRPLGKLIRHDEGRTNRASSINWHTSSVAINEKVNWWWQVQSKPRMYTPFRRRSERLPPAPHLCGPKAQGNLNQW